MKTLGDYLVEADFTSKASYPGRDKAKKNKRKAKGEKTNIIKKPYKRDNTWKDNAFDDPDGYDIRELEGDY